ncbi:4-alpha-glucanotransferase [Ponticoccus litoralis]|uniref:4-alpha-glucanotransferase n=1 Tax=Ponticoccus litoralis TaxID=422297 RepID=UPI003D2F3C3A
MTRRPSPASGTGRTSRGGGGWAGSLTPRRRPAMTSAPASAMFCGPCATCRPTRRPPEIVDHLHGQLAQSGAALVAVQLDDAFGCLEAQNLPGTIAEHPNWRRRLPVAVTALDRAAGMTRKT